MSGSVDYRDSSVLAAYQPFHLGLSNQTASYRPKSDLHPIQLLGPLQISEPKG